MIPPASPCPATNEPRELYLLLPLKPLYGEPVGTGNVGEWTGIRGNVREKQPRLDCRVERVRVQLCLRILRSVAILPEDALQKDDGVSIAAADIADEATPFGRLQDGSQGRDGCQRFRVHRDLAIFRAALRDFPGTPAAGLDLSEKGRKVTGRQETRSDHESVALECPAVLGGDQGREFFPARLCQVAGGIDASRMQPQSIEPSVANDWIRLE